MFQLSVCVYTAVIYIAKEQIAETYERNNWDR